VAISVWGKRQNNYYCEYMMNRHLNFLATLAAIRSIKSMFPRALTVLIEDKANGSAIIGVLRSEMLCSPVNPRGGKVARVNAISAAIESGHVFLPQGAPWVAEFIDQFAVFPAGAHDDMVDAASQALVRLTQSSGYFEMDEPDYDENGRRRIDDGMTIYLSDSQYHVYGDDERDTGFSSGPEMWLPY
jgi:predicted phage terminase large subunit-like protein